MSDRGFAGPRRDVGLVVYSRDLRIDDHPALAAAVAEHDAVVPAFVFDDRIVESGLVGANRLGFLLESLDDLDESLRSLGGALVIRRGGWVAEVLRLATASGARAIHLTDDLNPYARTRIASLQRQASAARVEVRRHPGIAVVPPGAVSPAGSDHYQVFTPYYSRWSQASLRRRVPAPTRITTVDEIPAGELPFLRDLTCGQRSVGLPLGGEHAARWRLASFAEQRLSSYGADRDDLAREGTSGLSPYLHFGCISPLDALLEVGNLPGADAFARQLCWRDFFSQVLAARPDAAWNDLHCRGGDWDTSPELLAAWRAGLTGYPIVDAAMRQLQHEGIMHNRARMIVASFLTKDLSIDWREGARHFLHLLVDADVANNNLNWQWVAGTGTDTNAHRVFNPTLQGRRHDPEGRYIRRHVPELRSLDAGDIHDPGPADRLRLGYPMPVVDHHDAVARYASRRGAPAGRSPRRGGG